MTDVRNQHGTENAHVCHYCGPTDRDLRPYGPGGAVVCFPCATATPEREAQAKNAFGALLDGAEAVSPIGSVMIGTEDGPTPVVTPPAEPCRQCGPGYRIGDEGCRHG